jgi:hypothetical protein
MILASFSRSPGGGLKEEQNSDPVAATGRFFGDRVYDTRGTSMRRCRHRRP